MRPIATLLRELERWPTSVSALTALLSLLVSVVTLLLQLSSSPPDSAPIVSLVEKEALLTVAKDVEGVLALYEPAALIRDLGVPSAIRESQREVQRWIGIQKIRERYEMLKAHATFPALAHLNITVTFNADGTTARAISSTEGTMRWDGGSEQNISTQGGEEWEFSKVGGVWKIKSFTCHRRPQ